MQANSATDYTHCVSEADLDIASVRLTLAHFKRYSLSALHGVVFMKENCHPALKEKSFCGFCSKTI